MIKRLLVGSLFLLALSAGAVQAQETYFGQNKVQYGHFDWKYIQTRHFDIYFYAEGYETAKFGAAVMESSYVVISKELNYLLQNRVPVFIYNSQTDFQETNIIPSQIPEAVGGFTEAFKNRIVIPFTGSYEEFRHVLHHELTHAVVYDMIYGNSLASLLSQRRLFDLPTWFAEGYAEYSSRRGWDYFSDMFVRDATINNYLTPPEYLEGYIAYKQGQAMIKYIVDKYGVEKLGEILQKGKVSLTMNKALKSSINLTEDEFYKDFTKEMKRRYWPEIAKRKEADEIASQLTKARKDGSYFNEQPVFNPKGDRIAIFTDKSDSTEIVTISPTDGKVLEHVVKAERNADLESVHSYVSGMSYSPDGRSLVFVAKSKGRDALMFVDVSRKKIYKRKRYDFYSIISPAWSPDGKSVVFAAVKGDRRDLYLYTIASDETKRLMDDRYDDGYPTWLPNSQEVIFSSDRPHPGKPALDYLDQPFTGTEPPRAGDFEYGDYNLFQLDLATLKISPIDVGPGSNHTPVASPDGKRVAFISDRNGIDNVYVGYLDSAKNYAVTDILTGVQSMTWSPDGQKLAFSAFYRGAFDIFVLKDLVPAGTNGVLTPTDFALGKYDNPFNRPAPSATPEPAVAKAPDTTTRPVASKVEADTLKHDSTALAAVPAHDSLKTIGPLAAPDTASKSAATTTTSPAATPDTSVHLATKDSTAHAAAKDSTSTKAAKDSTSLKTGIYGDEYVFVSNKKHDPLDSLMRDVAGSDSTGGKIKARPEPAAFDSVQGKLPTGEFKVQNYKVHFTPDYVGGGFAYDTYFGLQGQSYFIFSDYLGNHQIYVAADLVNTIDQSNIQAYYFNNTKRTNFGVGIFHTKNYYQDSQGFLFSDRFYGAQGFISRPFSTFARIEFLGAEYFIDRQYYDFLDPRVNRSTKVTTATLSYVTDNVLWGLTGPVNGGRSKFTLESGVDLFNSQDIQFFAAEFDYRKYWHFLKQFSVALRFAGAASSGTTPKRYFLGGTTNWIGSRTLDVTASQVENLYFSDVVTPLRGQQYYGLNGTRFGLMNLEARFPLVQYLAMKFPLPIVLANVNGATFIDMGATWDKDNFKGGTSSNGASRFQDIKTGFGFGMRANMFGLALLRWDIAWSTDFYKVSDHPTYYFSFGADF